MSSQETHMVYTFKFDDGSSLQYDLDIDPKTSLLAIPPAEELPKWTDLSFNQCPNCPLDPQSLKSCPVAANIATVVHDCDEIISHKIVEMQVTTPQRTVSGKTTAQRALSSLLGLFMATSDCPRTRFFRPMAYFHLPMASQEETIFRAVSTYFLAQYFANNNQDAFDLQALFEIYEDIQTVNEFIVKRLQACTSGDAAKNAVVLLHLLSCTLPMSLQESLDNLRPLFKGLIPNPESMDSKK